MTMRGFLLASMIFLFSSVTVVWLLRTEASGMGGLSVVIIDALASIVALGFILAHNAVWLTIPFITLILFGILSDRSRIMPVLNAVVGVFMLQAGFALLKGSIPLILPFWADIQLARIDEMLHGIAPWIWIYSAPDWLISIAVKFGPMLYTSVWAIAALGLPIIVAATDKDDARVRRTMLLYFFCWLGIGTILAILGSSVGPVFLGRLIETNSFSGLDAALLASGLNETSIGMTQKALWQGYASGNAGMGISAFPSVHLAIATLTAIYLGERHLGLLPLGVIFVVAIQFMSVFSGYHYAVDGYASIILLTLAWVALRHRTLARVGRAPKIEAST